MLTKEDILQEGYTDPFEICPGNWVAIHRFLFTYAILSGINRYGYEDRWCYSSYQDAKEALERWKLSYKEDSEPQGWHRHPASGRRVDKDGQAYINL